MEDEMYHFFGVIVLGFYFILFFIFNIDSRIAFLMVGSYLIGYSATILMIEAFNKLKSR